MPLSRSETMSRIRSRNTGPELIVRHALHAAGLRYRLHVRDLPGTPDIVLPSRRVVVEVRGCFWHQHPGCDNARLPATRQDYWLPKLARNVTRDRQNATTLHRMGWKVLVVWTCGISDQGLAALAARIKQIPRKSDLAGPRRIGHAGRHGCSNTARPREANRRLKRSSMDHVV
jgi:DNA mismatch endonuclease (patch repair protein)